MKVLYICPFAHYSGHPPFAAMNEPSTLGKYGHDVTLLTFCGIMKGMNEQVRSLTVVPREPYWIHKIFKLIRKFTIARWGLMLVETTLTIRKAIKLRNEYDVFHLRDGEPFLFVSHILSLKYRNIKWAVSLTASNLYAPYKVKTNANPFLWLYTTCLKFVNSKIWKGLYQRSLKRNQFIFMTQNEIARRGYEQYLGGVFKGKVRCVPLAVSDNNIKTISKKVARQRLGLPMDKIVLLSFGAPHSGKDIESVFKAVEGLEDVYLVHAGIQAFSLGSNPTKLAQTYGMDGRVKVFDYYIPEEEKPYFFCGSDVLMLAYTKAFKSTSSMLWEATKYGLSVISSDANTLGEDVSKYDLGLLYEAENAESMKLAITTFMKTTDMLKKRYKLNSKRFMDDYSPEKWTDRCNAIYFELCSKIKTLVVDSGGFDPLHDGHLDMFEEATEMGDKLICCLNSDDFIRRKRSKNGKEGETFYPDSWTRWRLVYNTLLGISARLRKRSCNLMDTVEVIFVIDEDNTVCKTLEMIRREYPDAEIIFANGGDRDSEKAIPETDVCKKNNIKMAFGIGGFKKMGSSSELVKRGY